MLKPKPVWGSGGTSGKRIPDTEDKPVSKGMYTIPASQIARGGKAGRKQLKGAAEQAAQSQWQKGMVTKRDRSTKEGAKEGAKIGAAIGAGTIALRSHRIARTYGTLRRAGHSHKLLAPATAGFSAGVVGRDAAAGALIGAAIGRKKEPVGKAMPTSAVAHMIPKPSQPMKMASAKPVQTLGLKKPKAPGVPTTVGKRSRYYDPEDRRQRRMGFAEGVTGAAGVGAAYTSGDFAHSRSSIVPRGTSFAREGNKVRAGAKGHELSYVLRSPKRLGASAALGVLAVGARRHGNSTSNARYT